MMALGDFLVLLGASLLFPKAHASFPHVEEGPEGCCPSGREGGKEAGSLTHMGAQSGSISLHPHQRPRPIPRLHENPKAGHPIFLTPCPRCHSLDPRAPAPISMNLQETVPPRARPARAAQGVGRLLLPRAWWTDGFICSRGQKEGEG